MDSLLDFARGLQWWHWWIAAAVLAVFETFIPGAVAIWFAAAAVVIGAVLLVVPIPWQLQLILFGALGVAAIFIYRRYRGVQDLASDQPLLNQRASQYVGQTFTLTEALSGGNGKIRVGDSVWLVKGADLPEGARVRVIGVRGAVFDVEPA
jgi:hypothetical protein